MLNIGKLAPSGADYYLNTVASGVEDYYTGRGEAPGYWTGSAADHLRLHGRVAAETLRAVLGGTDPRTGTLLGRPRSGRSVPGFDLTFRAPKSVSLLWGLGGPGIADQVRAAHDAAVAAGLAYLEQHAGVSRRGAGGHEQVNGRGFVAAAFRHRASRAGDPLLHTHVLVANAIQAVDDGRWRTLDARQLYRHGKTAGYLYQAQLRHELTRRLGVAWDTVHNGYADLAGIDRDVIDAFSQRRLEIEAAMDERGVTSARAAQAATLDTRRAKEHAVDGATLALQWTTRAAALGLDPGDVCRLVGRTRLEPPAADDVSRVLGHLASRDGLTRNRATFTRRDIVQALAEHLGGPLDAATIDTLADTAADDPDRWITLRPPGQDAETPTDEPRYTTPEMLDTEQRLLAAAVGRLGEPAAGVLRHVADEVLQQRPTITREQAHMVRRLTDGRDGVAVVVGRAGTGKTYALAAAREAWEQAGHRVVGAALAARAAIGLRDGAGIPATTIATLWRRLELDDDRAHLDRRTVLVIDEAAMVGTRTLTRLLERAAAAGTKVVLVGDHRQLPEIEAGGAFRGLVDRLPAITLTENRRQQHRWERRALAQLADGPASPAIAAYRDHDRITVAPSATRARDAIINDWCQHRKTTPPDRLAIFAHRGNDVAELNRRARARLTAAGHLTGPVITDASGRNYAQGDRVVFRRNRHLDRFGGHRQLVANGSHGTVTAVDPARHALTVELDDGAAVHVPHTYLADGHLDHGYATTVHRAQGTTVERALVQHSDSFSRELGYVAMSRAREGTQLYRASSLDDDLDVDNHGHISDAIDADRGLARTLNRRAAQSLASDQRVIGGSSSGCPEGRSLAGP